MAVLFNLRLVGSVRVLHKSYRIKPRKKISGTLFVILSTLFTDFVTYSPKLKAIASSASNTWGLFLLVLLLGYALVEIPRNLWLSSSAHYTLHHAYFKAAKLSADKCEAEDTLDDTLEVLYN